MSESNIGKTIEVFLIEGTPNGLIQCRVELFGIIGYKIPRKGLEKHKEQKHLKQAGIYFLFGKSEDEEKDKIYIGQAIKRKNDEGILYRLREHALKKDFWIEAIAFTTVDGADMDLNYLEHHLYKYAKNAGRYIVDNGNEPNPGVVSDARKSSFDKIIEDIKITTGILGHNVFIPVPTENVAVDERLYYINYGTDKEAKCKYTNEGCLLLEGSYIAEIKDSLSEGYIKLREKYKDSINSNNILTKNLPFTSVSAAASFVFGSTQNGQKAWKTSEGKSFNDVENVLNNS